jgi:hypothetical protein
MELFVGDHVKFLNESESGTVTKVLRNDKVMVEIESGLEVEVLSHELIRSGDGGRAKPKPVKVKESINPQEIKDSKSTSVKTRSFDKRITLDFSRNDNEQFDAYIINGYSEEISVYLFSRQDGAHKLLGRERIQGGSNVILSTLSLNEIDSLNYFLVEIVWLSGEDGNKRTPVSEKIKVKATKFAQKESFKSSLFLPQPSISLVVMEDYDLSSFDLSKLSEFKIESKDKGPKYSKPHKKTDSDKIDLHIEELIDDHYRLSNGEIVTLQLNALKKKIASSKMNGSRELLVIHGVGKGVLKTEVRNLLKSQGIKFSDGSYAQYGYGATLVEFY